MARPTLEMFLKLTGADKTSRGLDKVSDSSKKLDNTPALLSIQISYPSFFILVTAEGVSATLFSFGLFSFNTPIFIIIRYYSNVKCRLSQQELK